MSIILVQCNLLWIFENIVIFLPNDNRVLNFVPNVINLYTVEPRYKEVGYNKTLL